MSEKIIIDSREMENIIRDLAYQVQTAHSGTDDLLLVGIQRRGVDLARRIASVLDFKNAGPDIACLDINLYRDDWTRIADGAPRVGESRMPISPDNKTVVLIDDVLFSGRTVRAALEAILDYGRPAKIEFLTLVDRGHRELPICADYVGRNVKTEKGQHVDVLLRECDGQDAVILRY